MYHLGRHSSKIRKLYYRYTNNYLWGLYNFINDGNNVNNVKNKRFSDLNYNRKQFDEDMGKIFENYDAIKKHF